LVESDAIVTTSHPGSGRRFRIGTPRSRAGSSRKPTLRAWPPDRLRISSTIERSHALADVGPAVIHGSTEPRSTSTAPASAHGPASFHQSDGKAAAVVAAAQPRAPAVAG